MIKTISAEDVPALKDVLDHTGLFPSDLLPDMLTPALAGETRAFWLSYHQGGTAVAFCYTVPEELTDGTWNMLALAVHPNKQGKGFGSALVQAAEQYLREKGERILIVETSGRDTFALTRKFYHKLGYTEEARIRNFWADGDDKVIFAKAL